jgi:hypothetical protein
MFSHSNLVKDLAKELEFLAPLPNKTDLQKLINNLYIQLRIYGIDEKTTKKMIKKLLAKNNISKKELYN